MSLEGIMDMIAERVAAQVGRLLTTVLAGQHGPGLGKLLGVHEAASILSLSTSSVYKMSAAGKLPAVHLGNRLLFRLSDLEDYVEQNRRPSRGHHTRATWPGHVEDDRSSNA